MKVTLAATGKFHFLDLARQMNRLGALHRAFSAYPEWKLRPTGLPVGALQTFPWVHTPYMITQRWSRLPYRVSNLLDRFDRFSFDRYVARNLTPCDIFAAISGCGLLSGMRAKSMGAKYICDRGSSHIEFQNNILIEEHKKWGLPFSGIDQKIINRELLEYQNADLITVPSEFSLNSFISHGVPREKIALVPYGVDLSIFTPTGQPNREKFTITFVGGINLRKGIPYLIEAFKKIKIKNKVLQLVGHPDLHLIARLKSLSIWSSEIIMTGHIEQSQLKHYLSASDVLVLPSVEDGFGLVMAQALACGCPVIATENTGASELIKAGKNGFIVPTGNTDRLADAIEQLADYHDPIQLRQQAKASVVEIGGWDAYGDRMFEIYQSLSLCKPH